MKELLIELAHDGYTFRLSDSGFALRDAVEVQLTRRHQGTSQLWHRTKLISTNDYPNLENIIRDVREELNAAMAKGI
jgi:hypothetical protein